MSKIDELNEYLEYLEENGFEEDPVPMSCTKCDVYNYGFGESYCENCNGHHKFLKGDD